ncbi:YxlC family protein [Halalkalibacter alkaliphilus]|uniref:YxlC family protein n=1 Tax=Halalkalibacter alkaliphilus TaxID=2917993 RepID=A0A9X2A0Y5_9BACI|nr:YxlC family protein [Halalkalibacter alkaliphilus]MCL7746695.1 YxlC family protein [Halalkalibacter alkaliphilus]
MKRSEDQEHIRKLQQDWKQLDELGDRSSASFAEIKEQLAAYRVKQKQVFFKELIIFLATAVLILSVTLTSLFQAPVIFIVIQAGAVVVAPIIFFVLIRRKKREGAVVYDDV